MLLVVRHEVVVKCTKVCVKRVAYNGTLIAWGSISQYPLSSMNYRPATRIPTIPGWIQPNAELGVAGISIMAYSQPELLMP